MKNTMETERLYLSELSIAEVDFIFELLNTWQWIKFIGDKKIKTKADAEVYIRGIIDNPASNYWVVRLKETKQPIGLVTFMKRDYLENYDIGYAFLEQHGKKGFAYEAAKKLLDEVKLHHKKIVATVMRNNKNSIQLLEKLGLKFEKEILINQEPVLLYTTSK